MVLDTLNAAQMVSSHRLQRRNTSTEQGSHVEGFEPEPEPIAIVGLACRLPGEVNSASSLWQLLEEQRSGQSSVPSSRFNIDGFYQASRPDAPGGLNMKGGYFLSEDIRAFDNEFFGINAMEVTQMDPQQRKLLEVVFECLESAGIPLDQIAGSDTGCYVGNFSCDYPVMQMKDPEYLDRYSATGVGATILGNRISHAFNLLGPSMVIDTACSASLYCLHTACVALETKECDAAIVAGANLIQSVEQYLAMMKAGVLSATSTSHSFSDAADGYARAEGIGALYVKRLSDALRDNDPIRAVVRGTAVGHNGKTNGILRPSGSAQEAVIRKAYKKACLDLDGTSYIECHATGTRVGDLIEVEALSRVFNRSLEHPLRIGSIKTNIGHSEAVSGLSGLLKTVLALEKRRIPATIGVQSVNPKIKTANWGVKIVTENQEWRPQRPTSSSKTVLRAGVSSFGYGGANGHVILEAAEHWKKKIDQGAEGRSMIEGLDTPRKTTYLLPFSATSANALNARVSDISRFGTGDLDIADLAYTLGCRRTHFSCRGYLIAHKESLSNDLKIESLRTLPHIKPHTSPPECAFVFTGQGAQWAGMGKELFEEFPTFRKSIRDMDIILRQLPVPPSWTLEEVMFEPAETSPINNAPIAQPMVTAIQVAMVELLTSWRVFPKAVIGHSSGEIAAAFAAGEISSAQAIIAAYLRGYVNGLNKVDGAMMAVGLGSEDATSDVHLLGLCKKIALACVNSPTSVTLSGDAEAIATLLEDYQNRSIFARKLKTGGKAYHSHHMAVLGPQLVQMIEQALCHLPPSKYLNRKAEFISTVTGGPKDSHFDGKYWRANMESTVLFSQAVEHLINHHKVHVIEIGPHSALELPIKQIRAKLGIAEEHNPYSTALTRAKNGAECILNLLGRLYLHGQAMSFDKVNSQLKGTLPSVLPDLPPYSWQHDKVLWSEPRISLEFRNRKHPHHELLGSLIPGGDGLNKSWRNLLQRKHVQWLESHKLEEMVIFPAAGYIAMAIEAISQATDSTTSENMTSIKLRNITILSALVVPDNELEIFTSLRRKALSSGTKSKVWWEFEISSYQQDSPNTHATGSISIHSGDKEFQVMPPADLTDFKQSSAQSWYTKLAIGGMNFGPDFQSIKQVYTKSNGHARATVPFFRRINKTVQQGPAYIIHPITIDALLQNGIIANAAGSAGRPEGMMVVSMETAIFRRAPISTTEDSYLISSSATSMDFGCVTISSKLHDADGQLYAHIKNVGMASYIPATLQGNTAKRQPTLKVTWKPDFYQSLVANNDILDKLNSVLEIQWSAQSVQKEITSILSLLSHKNPKIRILVLSDAAAQQTLYEEAGFSTSIQQLRLYTSGYISENCKLFGSRVNVHIPPENKPRLMSCIEGQTYDVIIIRQPAYNSPNLAKMLGTLLADHGLILETIKSSLLSEDTFSFVYKTLPMTYERIIIARRKMDSQTKSMPLTIKTVIVVRDDSGLIDDSLVANLISILGPQTLRIKLSGVSQETLPTGAIVFSTLEVEQPLLSTITEKEMTHLKIIVERASKIVWATCGGFLQSPKPDFSLVSGLARTMMVEHPSLSFFTFDMERADIALPVTAQNLVNTLFQSAGSITDYEFIQHNDLIYVSRFVPDDQMNQIFRQCYDEEAAPMMLSEAKPCRLIIRRPGLSNTLYFKKENYSGATSVELGFVEVDVTVVGINSKDFSSLSSKIETRENTCIQEYCGVIRQVGHGTSRFSPGDRVVVMAPSHLQTHQIVPEWACFKLQDQEQFLAVCTLPYVFSTALYALNYRARIQPGETVLIHCEATDFGIAAIQIAKLAGVEIFTTANNEAQKSMLVSKCGIQETHVFSSSDSSFLEAIMVATKGRGVDVVLNTLSGDLLHDCWRACAPFGRFIELGTNDLDTGKLDMNVFKRNTTFSAVDLSMIFFDNHASSQALWANLLTKVMTLYRYGTITPIEPLQTFDVSELSKALHQVSSEERVGKVAVTVENPTSLLQVQLPQYSLFLDPQKTYFLVGCLSGIGSSISRWMMTRGARKFVFMGRSGVDRDSAQTQVDELRTSGADVRVARGDVSSFPDVKRIVAEVEGKIGGVLHAAMGLSEALFTQMSTKAWHTAIDPKLQGCWNLHNAIKGKDDELDFFLMTSSILGSIGAAAQSNYCSANYFLDVFARYRRSLGLPAVATGLGMITGVGYLHENPEIEALLSRTGISALDEGEMLQVIDIALSSKQQSSNPFDKFSESHILTGLEPSSYEALRAKNLEVYFPVMHDPRASVLAACITDADDRSVQGASESLPVEVATAISAGSSMGEAIASYIIQRFSALLQIPTERMDVSKSLVAFGMDSMIATEIRTWFFHAFKIDVPFFDLLAKSTTVGTLTERVVMTEMKGDGE
ncbi:MAG: hypothetical protein Q9187_002770 [Circinaria calcarea]